MKTKIDLRNFQFYTSLTENTRTDEEAKKAIDILNGEANTEFKHIAIFSEYTGRYKVYARKHTPDIVVCIKLCL